MLPIVLTIGLGILLPNVRSARPNGGDRPPLGDLVTPQRRTLTLPLWFASFLTMSVFYALINWLPTFFGRMGLDKGQAGLTMLVFTYTGAISFISGVLLQKPGRTLMLSLIGFGGTAGRLGVIVGPMSAGFILAAGQTHDTIYLLVMPIAGAALLARKSEQTRADLLHAAREIIFHDGLFNTRIADIVQHAGKSSGLFYLDFKNKRELFRSLVEEFSDNFLGSAPPDKIFH